MLERGVNYKQNPYNISHHTQSMLLHYLWKVAQNVNLLWCPLAVVKLGKHAGTAFLFHFRWGHHSPSLDNHCGWAWHIPVSTLCLVGMFCNHKMHKMWSVGSQKNYCHQMSEFEAKMHQIISGLGHPARELTGVPRPLAGL